jgi:hypothetical protein
MSKNFLSICMSVGLLCAAPLLASEPGSEAAPQAAQAASDRADESGSATTAAQTDAGRAPATGKAVAVTPQLKGSVKAVDIEAAECLRQMGDALSKMKRAALELMGESVRQDYISVGDPTVVGTMIIPALPVQGMAIGPYLPLRPKWVDYYLDQIGKLLPIYSELTDSLVMPESARTEATALLLRMRPLFEDARESYLALFEMSKDLKQADNHKVGLLAVAIHDDMEKMEKIRLDVFRLLKKTGKVK